MELFSFCNFALLLLNIYAKGIYSYYLVMNIFATIPLSPSVLVPSNNGRKVSSIASSEFHGQKILLTSSSAKNYHNVCGDFDGLAEWGSLMCPEEESTFADTNE